MGESSQFIDSLLTKNFVGVVGRLSFIDSELELSFKESALLHLSLLLLEGLISCGFVFQTIAERELLDIVFHNFTSCQSWVNVFLDWRRAVRFLKTISITWQNKLIGKHDWLIRIAYISIGGCIDKYCRASYAHISSWYIDD